MKDCDQQQKARQSVGEQPMQVEMVGMRSLGTVRYGRPGRVTQSEKGGGTA